MGALVRHWPRILVTLLPLVIVLLHATGAVRLGVLDRLDSIIYDSRLRATMPKTLDDRVVIVDIDEKSLADVGRWPWGRNRLSELTTELFERQKIALLGFDIVFAAATGEKQIDPLYGLTELGAVAANVIARAIARGVYEATALPFAGTLPSWKTRFATE